MIKMKRNAFLHVTSATISELPVSFPSLLSGTKNNLGK